MQSQWMPRSIPFELRGILIHLALVVRRASSRRRRQRWWRQQWWHANYMPCSQPTPTYRNRCRQSPRTARMPFERQQQKWYRNENGRCKIKTLLDRKWRKTIKRKIMHNSISVARVMHTTFSFGIEHHNHNTDSVVPFELFAEYLFPSERKTTRHLVKRWLSSVFFFRFCFSSVPYLFHIRWRTGSAVGILNGIVDASMLWDFRFNSSCVCRSILLPVSSTWHYNDPTTTRSFRFVWDCRLWYGKLCSRYPWCVGGVTAFPPHSAHFA